MDGLDSLLLARMPLAESVLLLWRHLFDEAHLQSIFQRHRGRCYEKTISFSTMVQLIGDALLQHGGSGNQSFARAQETGELEASVRAAYDKLARMPLSLSTAFFSESTDRLRELFPTAVRREPPESLREFTIVTVDGKTMKRVARRLKPLRKVSGGVLGGKALVATEFRTGMALAMAVDPDGHANDVKLVPELLPEVRRRTESLCLWMADRQFCDLVQMERFTEKGDHFLVRYHAKLGFHPDPDRCESRRVDREGREYVEEWGWLGRENHKLRRYVRRVRRDVSDEETISVVTDLLDENVYVGEDLLAMYRERFGIERMFQKVVEVFGLESMIGGTPEATIFQFAFCLLLYILIQLVGQIPLVRGYVAEQQKVEFETVSLEQLFIDVKRELIAWTVVVPADVSVLYFERTNASRRRERLRQLLQSQWSQRWKKSTNKKRRRHPVKKKQHTHYSVYQILQKQKK